MRCRDLWLPSSLLVLLGGCVSTSKTVFVRPQPIELARASFPDGREESYHLDTARSDRMSLVVKTRSTAEQATIGLSVREIDKGFAQDHALAPYGGLFVTEIVKGGPADLAGILPGDVLLELDGKKIIYLEQVDHIVERLAVDTLVPIVIERGGEGGQRLSLTLTTAGVAVPIEGSRSVGLDPSMSDNEFSGLIVGTIPREYSEKIYGLDRPTLIVGAVYLGSPAYTEGLRAGQRIVGVDGRQFESGDRLRDWIEFRGREGQPIELETEDPEEGRRRYRLELYDYSRETDVSIPLIFDYESSHTKTEWDLLLGLLMGYEGKYREHSRDGGRRYFDYHTEFSAIIGLFKVRSSDHGGGVRLLWLINIGSD